MSSSTRNNYFQFLFAFLFERITTTLSSRALSFNMAFNMSVALWIAFVSKCVRVYLVISAGMYRYVSKKFFFFFLKKKLNLRTTLNYVIFKMVTWYLKHHGSISTYPDVTQHILSRASIKNTFDICNPLFYFILISSIFFILCIYYLWIRTLLLLLLLECEKATFRYLKFISYMPHLNFLNLKCFKKVKNIWGAFTVR